MEKNKSKEHFLVVYNNDFDESRQNHLNAMDAYVYVTMKLMAGNTYCSSTLYATADSVCAYTFTQYARNMPQKFVNELRQSLKRIAENGFIPNKVDFDNHPMRYIYDIGVVRENDKSVTKISDGYKDAPYTLIPISAYNKIFNAFGLSEIMKVRIFYFYIKLSSLIGYKTGVCIYSLDIIAEKTNYSVNTVQAYIKILENYAVLTVYHMGKNIYGHANYPTNVLGQYYNKDIVLKYGKSVFDAYCMQYKLDKNGRRKKSDDQQTPA